VRYMTVRNGPPGPRDVPPGAGSRPATEPRPSRERVVEVLVPRRSPRRASLTPRPASPNQPDSSLSPPPTDLIPSSSPSAASPARPRSPTYSPITVESESSAAASSPSAAGQSTPTAADYDPSTPSVKTPSPPPPPRPPRPVVFGSQAL